MLNVPISPFTSNSPLDAADAATHIDTNGALTLDKHGRATVLLTEGDWLIGRGEGRVRSVLHGGLAVIFYARHLRLGGVVVRGEADLFGQASTEQPGEVVAVARAAHWLEARFTEAGCALSGIELCVLGAAGASPEQVGRITSWAHLWAAAHQLARVRHDLGGQVSRGFQFNCSDGHLTVVRNGQMRPAPQARSPC